MSQDQETETCLHDISSRVDFPVDQWIDNGSSQIRQVVHVQCLQTSRDMKIDMVVKLLEESRNFSLIRILSQPPRKLDSRHFISFHVLSWEQTWENGLSWKEWPIVGAPK
jgi:hypothetical protein